MDQRTIRFARDMDIVCTKCGAANPPEAVACRECSTSLASAKETVQDPAQSDPAVGQAGGQADRPAAGKAAGPAAGTIAVDNDISSAPTRTPDNPEKVSVDLKIRDTMVNKMVGEYQITGVIGRGGMGTVYSGIQPLIGKRVAVKVLKASLSDDAEMLDRFLAEARAVNKIGHPNIVDIFSFGKFEDGTQYCVMEYLPGESLASYLKKHHSISIREAATIFTGILDALESAHAHNIVHRDLKPDNIFLAERPDGGFFVKLLDFGIAKFVEEGVKTGQTKTGVPIGTPHYMSPEQCRGRGVDHRADLYSVGIILYQVFTGTVPFDSDSFFEVIQCHLREQPRPPSELAELPDGLEEIILWCLAKEKNERPADVGELKARLIPLLRELSGMTASVTPVQLKYTPSHQSYPASLAGGERIGTGPAPTAPVRPRRTFVYGIPIGVALAAAAAITAYYLVGRPGSKRKPAASVRPRPEPPPTPEPRTQPDQKTVTIQLLIHPKNVKKEIWLDGKKVNTSILNVPKSKTEAIEIKVLAKGYQPYVTRLLPMGDIPLPIQLQKLPEPPADPATGRRRRRRRTRAGRTGPGRQEPRTTRKPPEDRNKIQTFPDL